MEFPYKLGSVAGPVTQANGGLRNRGWIEIYPDLRPTTTWLYQFFIPPLQVIRWNKEELLPTVRGPLPGPSPQKACELAPPSPSGEVVMVTNAQENTTMAVQYNKQTNLNPI